MRLVTTLAIAVLLMLLSGCATVPPAKQEVARDAVKEAVPGTMTPAPKQARPPGWAVGSWKGMWRGTGSSGELGMDVVLGPDISTIWATQAPNFGANPVAVVLTLERDDELNFIAKGADGNIFSGTLKSNLERTILSGWGIYRSNSIWGELRKK